jgi:peptidoglycan-N-acetylglucosamine deacetylase
MGSFKKIRILFIITMLIVIVSDYFIAVNLLFYIVPIVLFLTYIVAGSSILSLNVFKKAYTHPATLDKELAITFDDGPSPSTLAVLDTLKSFNAKATFFCIGKKIEEHPDVMRRIIAEGHMIGNHSYSHSNWFPFYGSKTITEEINKTNVLISQFAGQSNDLFRPPFGVMNPSIAKAAASTKQIVIGWSLRSFDTSTKDKDKVVNRIKSKLRPGTVLLLHDDRLKTPHILESILQYAQINNYKFVDVRSIFKLKKT